MRLKDGYAVIVGSRQSGARLSMRQTGVKSFQNIRPKRLDDGSALLIDFDDLE